MLPSMFNVKVPVAERNEVFLMNTFTDAQVMVTPDVIELLDRLAAGESPRAESERATIEELAVHGFVVNDRAQERRDLEAFFREVREGTETLKVTVLTTLQCNFACDYCIQGDHGDYNKAAARMSMAMAQRLAAWMETRLDAVAPSRLILTFFGGEPLLNMPVLYYLAERMHASSAARGVQLVIK